MTDARWQRIKDTVAAALELPTPERDAFVDRSCTDPDMRREVRSLLANAADDSLPGARAAIATLARRLSSQSARDTGQALTRTIGDRYDVLVVLGEGGMGTVYLARERALERFVAIKVLRSDLAASPELRERFRREARIVAALAHPGILSLYTVGEAEDTWYLVTAYVRGLSLADHIRIKGPFDATEVCRVMRELADTLCFAHEHGVVHRDIKPANVMLDAESGRTVLADFGISAFLGAEDRFAREGVAVGTPRFMAPEQATGHGVDARSDIYSLGAVAYAMLTGDAPAADEADRTAALRVLVQQDEAAGSFAAVVARCLATNPDARFHSAKELRAACERALGQLAGMPEGARDLPSFAPYAALWAIGWSSAAALPGREFSERVILALIALLVPVGLLLHVWNIGARELSFREVLRVSWWPPEWWGMWWPRRLRRPTDLWNRLPFASRIVRVTLSIFFVAEPFLIAIRPWMMHRPGADASVGRNIAAAELALLGITVTIVVWGIDWTRRRGLRLSDAVRFLFASTADSARWHDPSLARLLIPRANAVSLFDTRSSDAHLEGILIGIAGTPLERRVRNVANELLASIDMLGVECDELTRQTGLGEDERASDDASRERLRDLRARLEAVTRTAAVQRVFVSGLHAQAARARLGVSAPGATRRLSALLDEIEQSLARQRARG